VTGSGRIVLSPRPVAPNPLGGERDIALGAAKNPGTVSFAEPSFAVGLIDDESAAGREVLPLIIVRWNRPGIPCIGRLPLRPGIPCIGRLPPCPAAGGAFLCGPRRSAQPMMRRRVGVVGLLTFLPPGETASPIEQA
jgi:hypothetical protein